MTTPDPVSALMALADDYACVSYAARSASAAKGSSARAALRAAIVEAVKVPQGWKLVPVEMTQEMNDAGRAALSNGSVPLAAVYRAVLAAAPPADAALKTRGE